MSEAESYERVEYGVGGHTCPHCGQPAALHMVMTKPLKLVVKDTCAFPYCSQECRQASHAALTAQQVARALGG